MFHGDFHFQASDFPLFVTLILLEGVLSFDNAAILAALVRKLPLEQRRRALLYGIGGAYLFRSLAIFSVSFISQNAWVKVLGAVYLIYLAVKHFLSHEPHEQMAVEEKGLLARFRLSGFWSVVVAVELADIAFALDQILVAVAMTNRVPVIILAACVAILLLRISAAYMSRIMDWFPALESLAYVAVAFVGLKLIVEETANYLGYCSPEYFCDRGLFHVPKFVSVTITLSLLVVPPLVKFVYERVRARSALSG